MKIKIKYSWQEWQGRTLALQNLTNLKIQTMPKPFKNRKNIRWRKWDYRWDASYFITICTKDRQHYFGEIKNKKMILSRVGVIVDVLWHEIPFHTKYLTLDAFVVMPNHLHGILILEGNNAELENEYHVGQGYALAKLGQNDKPNKTPDQTRFQNIGKNSISSILGSYKSAVTKHINRLKLESAWQVRFHDHVIRNEREYNRIQNYILTNPENWENDCFNDKKE